MSNLLSNLLKASAKVLLHLTTKEQNKHTEYAIDIYVLDHYRTGFPPTRLHTSWKGPIKVIKRFNFCYTLLDPISCKEMDFHVSDMKPFVFGSAVVDPMDVAHHDYFVDKIPQHRGNPKKLSSMEFEVSWINYHRNRIRIYGSVVPHMSTWPQII